MADPRRIRELLGGKDAVMSAYEPSWRDRFAGLLGDAVGGDDIIRNRNVYEKAQDLVDFVPFAGDAVGANEVYRDLEAGRYGPAAVGAGLTAIGMVPGVGDVAKEVGGKAVKKVAKTVGDMLPAADEAVTVAGEFTDSAKKEMKAKIKKILGGKTDAPTSPRLGEPKTQQGFSNVTARRPIKEMSAVYLPSEEMLPERFIRPEDFKIGDYVYPLPGDRTIAGRSLYGVNEMDFPNYVDLLGGGGYMRSKFQQGPDRSGWANQLTAAARHANDIRRLSEKGGTVHGGFVTMGKDASDFSNMSGDAVRQSLLARRPFISPNDEELFNKIMREGGTAEDAPYPDFPGIFNMSDEYLNSSGDMRKKLIKRMDSADIMDRGFPDVGAIRKALTEPDLYNANNLDMGWAFSRMDPEGRLITDPSIVHPSYDTQIGGAYEGRFKHLAPMEVHSPDYWRARERVKPGENPSHREYTYKLRLPPQKVDQEWIDLNSGYQEAAENGNPEEYLQRIRRGAGF